MWLLFQTGDASGWERRLGKGQRWKARGEVSYSRQSPKLVGGERGGEQSG